jgi:hypothetical protein
VICYVKKKEIPLRALHPEKFIERRLKVMADKKLQGMKVAILATNGFEQPELTEPRKALEQEGARTTIISPKAGKIYAMKHHDKGDQFEVNMTFDEANPKTSMPSSSPEGR